MVSSSAGFHGLLILRGREPGPRPSLPQEVGGVHVPHGKYVQKLGNVHMWLIFCTCG